eukprot:14151863-Ditylum_brightwellii.AAC.1
MLKEFLDNVPNDYSQPVADALRDLVSSVDEETSTGEENNNGSSDKKLNILLLYADDWRFDSVGYLNPEVHTPALN